MVTKSQQNEIDRKELHKIKMSKNIDDPADKLRHRIEQRKRKEESERLRSLPEEQQRQHCIDWQSARLEDSEIALEKYKKEKLDLLSKPVGVFDAVFNSKERKINALNEKIQEYTERVNERKKKIEDCAKGIR